MKYLGIDYGDKNIGIAISDSKGIMAFPYDVIKNDNEAIQNIMKIVEENNVKTIVIGKPVNLSGKENIATEKAMKMYRELKEIFENVVLFDERLTTSMAHVIGKKMGLDNRKRKKKVDKIAASIILNDYLNGVKKDD